MEAYFLQPVVLNHDAEMLCDIIRLDSFSQLIYIDEV